MHHIAAGARLHFCHVKSCPRHLLALQPWTSPVSFGLSLSLLLYKMGKMTPTLGVARRIKLIQIIMFEIKCLNKSGEALC